MHNVARWLDRGFDALGNYPWLVVLPLILASFGILLAMIISLPLGFYLERAEERREGIQTVRD